MDIQSKIIQPEQTPFVLTSILQFQLCSIEKPDAHFQLAFYAHSKVRVILACVMFRSQLYCIGNINIEAN